MHRRSCPFCGLVGDTCDADDLTAAMRDAVIAEYGRLPCTTCAEWLGECEECGRLYRREARRGDLCEDCAYWADPLTGADERDEEY